MTNNRVQKKEQDLTGSQSTGLKLAPVLSLFLLAPLVRLSGTCQEQNPPRCPENTWCIYNGSYKPCPRFCFYVSCHCA